MPGSVRKDIQLAVDQYMELYQQQKELKDKLDTLRGMIEPYMQEHEFDSISASDGRGRVERTVQERALQTSRFTAYDVQEISTLLPTSLRKKCFVEVVDKDKLEALCKLGEVDPEILEHKQTKPSVTFSVRLQK